MQIGDWFACPHGSTHGHRPFKSFTVEIAGETRVIDSIHAAERVERETMSRFKAGEKIAPVVFRAFHYDQDGKHYDSNSFGPPPVPTHDFHRTTSGRPIGFGSGKLEE